MLKQILIRQTQASTAGVIPFRWALAGLSLSTLLSSLSTSIANVALPTLTTEFNVSFQAVQWVVIAYLLAITVFIVSAGRLGDSIGRRRLLIAGLALFTLASVLCGAAPGLWFLVAARAAQGLGAAIMTAMTMAMVGDAVPASKTGRAMGLLGTMSAIGTALGPSLGGMLIAALGWRSIFFVSVPLGALTLLIVYRTLPADRQAAAASQSSFDTVGTLLLALTLSGYALALTIGRGTFGPLNFALLAVAVLGAGLFAFAETRTKTPLVRLAMFRDPTLGAGFAMSALVTTVVMATLVVGPFYLSGGLALDTVAVGLVMSLGPLVAAVTGVPAGRAVDRFGASGMTIAGLIAMAAGAFALAVMPAAFGVSGYTIALVVITAGYALFQAANNTAILTNVVVAQRGVVSGILNLSRNLGLITGASVMGAIFALAVGTSDISTARAGAVAAGMRFAFGVAVALIAVALLFAAGARIFGRRAAVDGQLQ